MSTDYEKFLPFYLAVYLRMPSPLSMGTTTNLVPEFVCPSYLHTLPEITAPSANPNSDNYNNAYSYSVTRTNSYPYSLLAPVGYPFGDGAQPSLSLANLSSVAPLAQVWAMADWIGSACRIPPASELITTTSP